MDRRRIKRTLVNEVVSDGDALPLDGAAVDDGTQLPYPTRHGTSGDCASSVSIGSYADFPDENRNNETTGTTKTRSDFNGGRLMQKNREITDGRVTPFTALANGVVERRRRSKAAAPAILTDKFVSLRRTIGHGDERQERLGDGEYGQITAESSHTFGRHVPIRKTFTNPVLAQKRPDIDSVHDNERHSGKYTVARRPVDVGTDEMTFFYPNQVLLQTRDETNVTKHWTPSSHPAHQTVKRKTRQAEVAFVDSSSASSEQMVEHEYITLDLVGKPDDQSEENSTGFDIQDIAANTDNVPSSNSRNVQHDDEWRRIHGTRRLPANYPVENTMSTRL